MKLRLVALAFMAFAIALLAFGIKEIKSKNQPAYEVAQAKKLNTVSCRPNWDELTDILNETDIPPIPGAGSYQWKINTSNDSAQFYFNQGINMYYSFHIIEAMASFKKASKFDPGCAMLYWAQALAYGPNINDLGYAASPEALQATNKAKELSSTANETEKALIDAMTVRYTADSADINRKQLNESYTAKMKQLYEKYPGHPDIAALYADAMMLEHPWDLWNIDGTPKPWEPVIQEVLEKLLEKAPSNPGANHYYIHVMEPSPYAAKALPCADRLGKLTPGLSHTVHMPSHIYLRTGNYAKGISVNEAAIQQFQNTVQLYQPAEGGAFLYLIHNLHMQTNNAMMAGRSAAATTAANETAKNIPAEVLSIPSGLGNYAQYLYMTPTLVHVRFGNWDQLLKAPKPAGHLTYANILYHLGKGMAYVQRSGIAKAKNELAALQELMKDTILHAPFTPFSMAMDGAAVAENLLIGAIALKEKKYSEAIVAFEEAAVTEETMVYNEPRDWMLNPKHYLGNSYLKAGRTKDAKEILQKDLLNNNENGWALFGVWQALVKEKRTAEANKVLQRFRKAFEKADVKLYGPVF
jgi:tetratricopeptide (TPR) repeat protein